ncbi:MAG: carnitine dehydratase, partial [Microbacteriaceae bacterium]|nr:carnitine dehydratase [Microbacteriaceae bacterium]
MTDSTTITRTARFPEIDPETRYDMLIGGEWVQAADGATFRCVDPFDEL